MSGQVPQMGKPAPAFKTTAPVGGKFKENSLEDCKGKDVVLMDNQSTKRRLVDRVCPPKVQEIVPEIHAYQEMLDLERRLDFNITRRTLDIKESMRRPAQVKKTLRIFLTNLFYTQQDGAPSWELRVEGRLMDDTRSVRKFSSFFKSLVIELDSSIYGPDNHLVEWHRTAATSETDGFQVRRPGDLPVKCTILFQLEHQPPHYKIDPKLARLLGKQTDTRPAVINALWQYIKTKTLQDSNEREYINNDNYLAQIFECKRMKFSEIPAKLSNLLSPPDPIVIHHSIVRPARNLTETQRETQRIDFEVEVEDHIDAGILNHDTQEIKQLDEKVFGIVADIKRSVTNFGFFSDFSKDPQQSITKWLATQSTDLKLMTDQLGDVEEERRADYYYQPWMQEAVCRYFYRKVQERRNDLELALSSVRR